MAQPTPTPEKPPDSTIGAALWALAQDRGVYQNDLLGVLGPQLSERLRVGVDDDERVVLMKVIWQLERLIDGLGDEDAKAVARVRFNLTNLPGFSSLTLTRRVQRYQDDHRGPSLKTSDRRMRDPIVPSFERRLSRGPLPPVPDAVLTMTHEALGELPNTAAELVEPTLGREPTAKPRVPTWLAVMLAIVLLVIGGVVGWFVHPGASNIASGNQPPTGQQQTSPPGGPTGTGVYQETAGSGGARTYTDPHTLDTSGPTLTPYQQITVACKVYAPVMPSVAPGWWYRIVGLASQPLYAPANSFMNGDPPGVDVHKVDDKVLMCP